MKYYDVVSDILEYYSDDINEKEKEVINKILFIVKDKNINEISDEIIMFINRILDRIWNLELTDVKSYKNGDDFSFLVKDIFYYFYSDVSNEIVDVNQDTFELINNKNIINKDIEECGEIISINYTNNVRNVPLLPIYFKDGKVRVNKLNYNVDGYYAVDTHVDKTDPNIDLINDLKEKNKKSTILLDKSLYREYENIDILSDRDVYSLGVLYILKYLDNKRDVINSFDYLKYRDSIYKKIKNKVRTLIFKLYNNKIDHNEFENRIYKLIDESFVLTSVKKL